MVQHPVGQGGLFSGVLNAGARPVRWVYDCGSNQCEALAREIVGVAERGAIDLLFLSHLDSDHVRGVDQLLSSTKVREVVLPYLNETMLLITIARDSERGALSGAFVEAAGDLAGWFGDRGVETVTFINGGDDGEGDGDGPILPGEPGGDRDGDVRAKWSLSPVELGSRQAAEENASGQTGERRARLQQIQPGAAILMASSGALLNWVLLPYVHTPPARLIKAFEAALEAEFGSPLDTKAIVLAAKDQAVRDRLRGCYDALWLDHNLISMTLYCGPWRPEQFDVSICLVSSHYRGWHGAEPGGWILTGDAHLDRLRRRQRFLHFYRDHLPLTNIFMTPHHGSAHNHSDEVLGAMPNLRVGFAAAGPNSYGHPHDAVRDAVNAQPTAAFLQVSEALATRLVLDLAD